MSKTSSDTLKYLFFFERERVFHKHIAMLKEIRDLRLKPFLEASGSPSCL
jgi:hypothetical protein